MPVICGVYLGFAKNVDFIVSESLPFKSSVVKFNAGAVATAPATGCRDDAGSADSFFSQARASGARDFQ